jgi:hypothetical protein
MISIETFNNFLENVIILLKIVLPVVRIAREHSRKVEPTAQLYR